MFLDDSLDVFYGTKVLKSIVFPKHNWFLLPHHLSKYQLSKYVFVSESFHNMPLAT